jgi:hypothetical protein
MYKAVKNVYSESEPKFRFLKWTSWFWWQIFDWSRLIVENHFRSEIK